MKYICVLVIVCSVLEIQGYNGNMCNNCQSYLRIKRAKYYNSPPLRIYSAPPNAYPVKGPFSYTPPPGYNMNTEPPPSQRTYKVSKRPTNPGLGDEDLHNIVKYLSKQDLNKIFELARDKDGYSGHMSSDNNFEYEKHNRFKDSRPPMQDDEDLDMKVFTFKGPYADVNDGGRPKDSDFVNPNINSNPYNDIDSKYNNYGPAKDNQAYSQSPFESDESKQHEQISFLDAYIEKEIRGDIPHKTDDKAPEEWLPQPANLRDSDVDIAFTNKVPKIIKSDSTSYQLENFADLPLMNYDDSKLDTVNSYNVPHYTVISQSSQQQSLSKPQSAPLAARPGSPGRDQSDAHLMAIKIWTHKSKGTAYTLHNDGTLSLEKPRPKYYHS